jgi:hypothetical protein
VQSLQLAAGNGEHAEGIVVAEVGFLSERKAHDVSKRSKIVWSDADGVELSPVVRHVRVGEFQCLLQARDLKPRQRAALHCFRNGIKHK